MRQKCFYDYPNSCTCSEDNKCGCDYDNNMAGDFSCNFDNTKMVSQMQEKACFQNHLSQQTKN